MSVEENKAIVRRATEEVSKGNTDAVREMHTRDYFHHNRGDGRNIDSVFNDVVEKDQQAQIEDIMAEGDRVAVWETCTKKEETFKACMILRLSDGKIAESWNMTDIQKTD